ncbi:MAG: cation-transporting P-type ATPase, partial [Coriobacteriales bacterium]|nr:cation-transporting P-type ATPase [Coriobacteriales bacterium]
MKAYLSDSVEVLEVQHANAETGLTSAEAQTRLEKVGPNKLKEAEKDPLWKRFFA